MRSNRSDAVIVSAEAGSQLASRVVTARGSDRQIWRADASIRVGICITA